ECVPLFRKGPGWSVPAGAAACRSVWILDDARHARNGVNLHPGASDTRRQAALLEVVHVPGERATGGTSPPLYQPMTTCGHPSPPGTPARLLPTDAARA